MANESGHVVSDGYGLQTWPRSLEPSGEYILDSWVYQDQEEEDTWWVYCKWCGHREVSVPSAIEAATVAFWHSRSEQHERSVG